MNAVPLELVAVRDYYEQDAEEIVALFREAVCGVQARSRAASTPADARELDAWRARLAANRTLVAIDAVSIVAFAELERDGHVVHFFVRPGRAGLGIGALVLRAIETLARARGLPWLTVDVPEEACPCLERHGFSRRLVLEPECGVPFYRMAKRLA